jgi:hypothetical protein
MSDLLDRAEQYRQRAEEFAGRGGDHKNRANHYASAVRYLQLAEAKSKLAARSDRSLRSRVEALFSRPG